MADLEQLYKENIIAVYSDISFARLSNPGELIDRALSLKDIFFPTKLSPLQEYREFRIRTVPEDDEFLGETQLREENRELIEEILSLLPAGQETPDPFDDGPSEADPADRSAVLSEKNKVENGAGYAADRRMIIGKPGSGKSTYIRRLALAYATGEKEFLQNCGYEENVFPVFVQFKRLSGILQEDTEFIHLAEKDFAEFLYRATCYEFSGFEKSVSLPAFRGLIAEKRQANALLVVADSFDEIGEEARYLFTKNVRTFLGGRDGLLICSREGSFDLSYSRESKARVTEELCRIPGLRYQNIYDLTDDEIKIFVRKWFDVVFWGDANNTIKADRIIRSLSSGRSPYLRQIKRIPLYLSNILCIARNTGEIPRSKDEVLEKFVELCLNSSVNETREYDNLKKQLAYLAYIMTVNAKKTVSERELRQILLDCYAELDGSFYPEVPKNDTDGYIKGVLFQWNRGDIFKACRSYAGENIYQFEHLLFQEYFTAYAVNKLYCPNVNRRTQPIDILEPHFREVNISRSDWREIILMAALMEKQRWGAEEYVEKLLDLVKQEKENYHYSNMLFEIVLSNTNMSRELRHDVYRALFAEHITDRQIHDICDGVDNDSLPGEFIAYIEQGFEESTRTDTAMFPYACAVIRAEKCVRDHIDPMQYAGRLLTDGDDAGCLLTDGDDTGRILGVYMICMIAWCRYNHIVTKFTEYECRITEDIMRGLADCISSPHILSVRAVSTALRDMALAEYFDDTAGHWDLIADRCRAELPDRKKQPYIRKILSILPIRFSIVDRLQEVIKKEIGEEVIKAFDKSYEEGRAEECVDSFVECALAHRWAFDEEIHKAMREVQILVLESKGTAEEVKIRLQQIYRQVSVLPDPAAEDIANGSPAIGS